MSKVDAKPKIVETYIPTEEEADAQTQVLKDFITGRTVLQKSYNQFNGRTLYDVIDDWTKRWNGYLVLPDILSDNPQSSIFLNFTRNAIVAWLSKVAMDTPTANIVATNRKSGSNSKRMAEIFKDMLKYSRNNENYSQKFLALALEVITKGTGIVYEGYAKTTQEMKVPDGFDMETGKGKFKKEKKTIFDDCFQKIVPIEDFYIANPYQPDVQKQPFIIWREITTYEEAKSEYGHYDNFDYVKEGAYALTTEPTTFYRNKLQTELASNQVEILKYFNRSKNLHIVTVNGVVLYNGPIPFKDGKYPFAKGIFEPYGNDFFWGYGFPNKVMGEQDLANVFFNMMVDKTTGSLLPYGLSSDLDDLIEDDVLAPNKIRKVSDINKWKFDTLPSVNAAEQAMLQTTIGFLKENSGDLIGAGTASSPKGGKLQVRQVMLRQQEAMQKLGFSMNFLEDFEHDATELRLAHLLQFYSIPKIEKITGRGGKEIEQLLYRDIQLHNVKLSSGETGDRIIKLVGEESKGEEQKNKIADELSIMEEKGYHQGIPTEALAISIDTFMDYNYEVQVVKNSSYEKNEILDQASRQEYANWRLSMMQYGVQVDADELVKYVDEAYDIDSERFTPKQQPNQQGQPNMPGQDQNAQGGAPVAPGQTPPANPAMAGIKQMTKMPQMAGEM